MTEIIVQTSNSMGKTEVYDCKEECHKLWKVYTEIISNPQRVVRVRKDGREVEYGTFNLKDLENLYMIHWNSCPNKVGLPPAIGKNAHIQRGGSLSARFI